MRAGAEDGWEGAPADALRARASGRGRRKRRRVAAAACNCAGILILLSVIALLLPAVLPQIAGIQVLRIETGSMEPAIPVGSAVFVVPDDPADAVAGDVVAFTRNESVVVHRVSSNNVVEGALSTKGDANADVDLDRVSYASYQGSVALAVPALGDILAVLTTTVGKVYLLAFAVCGVLFNVLAARLRARV